MKITRLLAYRVALPLREGGYKWSGGKSVDVVDSTIVRVETDAGLAGHGEACPLRPAYAEGGARTRAASAGADPRELDRSKPFQLTRHPSAILEK